MDSYLDYFLLGAGVLILLIALIDKSGKAGTLLLAATVMVMRGLPTLQFLGTEDPS